MVDNVFDSYRDNTFDTVARAMGKIGVSWSPSAGGSPQICDTLFNDPSSIKKLGETGQLEYNPTDSHVEYRKPFFPGLKESVDAGNSEYLYIGTDRYYIRSVHNTWDGNTNVAILEKNNT